MPPPGLTPAGFGLTETRRILRAGGPGCTAVFAGDDYVATGAAKALREAGLDVPGEVSLVGFNDTPYIAEDLDPPLTTVHVPAEELGRTAVTLALHRDDPGAPREQQIVLGAHVVVRDSVRPLIRRMSG